MLRARLSRSDRTKLFGFTVRKLSRASFRIVLWEIFFQGQYHFPAKTDAPVIFDCGASIGMATLFFKHAYPKCRIIAFEADPNTAAVLKENVSANRLEDVTVHNLMLTNDDGERAFYPGDGESGNLMGSENPDRLSLGREIKVNAARLSNFIDGKIDFLKLDVEGSEFNVLADLSASGKISQIEKT